MAREDEAREPEREEGGVLEDGVGAVVGEEVLDPGGVVRLLAGAAVEAEAHAIEGGLVGAPLGRKRGRGRGAEDGEAGEERDVLEGDGGLPPGEGEGGGGGGPEGGEVEDGGGVALEAEGGREDGVVDAEVAPEAAVAGPELGDPVFPVAGDAEPAAEGDAVLGGSGGLGRRRRAEGGRRGRWRRVVERGEEVRQAGRSPLLHVQWDLVDEEEDVLVPVPVVGGHDGGGGGGGLHWVSGVSDHINLTRPPARSSWE